MWFFDAGTAGKRMSRCTGDIPTGTLRAILKQANLTEQDLRNL